MSNLSTRTDLIESRIDKTATGELAVGKGGTLDFTNLNQIMEVAKVVAIAKEAIPRHLRENVGACLAVCIQASEWRMSPFAVANKSYVVNDRMAYEAQLVAAVILMRAPIKGRLKYTYTGKDGTRQCTCTATLAEGDTVEYQTPEIGKIKVKNSPLWQNDPDQQLAYFAARSLARRHFPDVILGVYTPEEMAEEASVMREVTPKPQIGLPDEPKPSRESVDVESTPASEPSTEASPAVELASEESIMQLKERYDEAGLMESDFKKRAAALGIGITSRDKLNAYTAEQVDAINDRWSEIVPSA